MTHPQADLIGTSHTVRVSCACSLCRTNATYLGLPLPLVAYIRPEATAALKITPDNANSRSKSSSAHGCVYMAHSPTVGPYQRMAIPVAE